MKRIFLLASLLSLTLFSCNNKENEKNTEEVKAPAEEVITDAERLEGKVVMAETGEWYVIKNGQRWRAMSEPATTDYLNSILNGENNVEKGIPNATLEQFPIVGEILPKLEFKLDNIEQK